MTEEQVMMVLCKLTNLHIQDIKEILKVLYERVHILEEKVKKLENGQDNFRVGSDKDIQT